ncbi:hypothetical protein FRAAL6151 [Frankia alni ACN14a]|uniref:Uncharacterized protein n=1 Tax=Frankia alni (strain DSM 45986 / CECT 9034 / ACN14a) TaxID=326424 RepID=Q0RCQ0_FRAAA|nr:hypothetical protein FRAAL6151 [Frankia alni ACN14a]
MPPFPFCHLTHPACHTPGSPQSAFHTTLTTHLGRLRCAEPAELRHARRIAARFARAGPGLRRPRTWAGGGTCEAEV